MATPKVNSVKAALQGPTEAEQQKPELSAEQQRPAISLDDLTGPRKDLLDEMVNESSAASIIGSASDDIARLAAEAGFDVAQTFESSALYHREMGTIMFRLEACKTAISPNNGEYRGAMVRIIGQDLSALPPSIQQRITKGDPLFIPIGSFDESGTLRSPVLSELDDAPLGSVWALQPPRYIPASGNSPGGFERTPTSGGRSFFPYKLHRLSLKKS